MKWGLISEYQYCSKSQGGVDANGATHTHRTRTGAERNSATAVQLAVRKSRDTNRGGDTYLMVH